MYCEIPTCGRCCFCLPLRQGILLFGYINMMFTACMIGLFSYSVHFSMSISLMVFNTTLSEYEDIISLVIYCSAFTINLILVCGAHMRNLLCLRIFHGGILAVLGAILTLQIIGIVLSIVYESYLYIEIIPIFLLCMGLNVYLYCPVKSLIRKLETSNTGFENQLHQFLNGEVKLSENVVYRSTVDLVEIV